ncbi:DUF927 domain-containing protein [Cytobacillus firmus]|uniref:DUF927 domain-containing protein n=1 Tax=Cytobacillus firmus TaxID=1399 RepID=UPI003BA12FC5
MTEKNKAAGGNGQPGLDTCESVAMNNFDNSIISHFDSETAAGFLKTVFPGIKKGYVAISYKGESGFHTTAFPAGAWDKIVTFSENKRELDLYFALGVLGTSPKKGQRGKIDDVIAVPGVWLDIDCAEGEHSADNLPTFEEAELKLLTAFPFPSILVHSGGGLHAYWLFPELISTERAADREEVKRLSERFQRAFIQFAKEKHGWKLDNTSDLARVLRIPGSINHKQKDHIKPVTILKAIDKRYTVQELEGAISKLESQVPKQQPAGPADRAERKAILGPIVEGCGFMKHCQDNAERLPEPDWYKMLTIVAKTEEGPKAAHEWSQKDSRYSYEETEAKIQHALNDTGPVTCQKIQEEHGLEFCQGCQFFNKVQSPIVIGLEALKEEDKQSAITAIEAAAAKTKEDAGAALEPIIIDHLLFLEKAFIADYERMTALLIKAGVKRRSLQAAMRKQRAKQQQKQETGDRTPLDQWKIEDNILFKKKYSEGSFSWKAVTRTAPEIKKVLTNDQDGQEYWEIQFETVRGRYITVTVPRAKMATKKGLIEELSKYGFDVKESSARDIIDYLHDFDAAHADDLPTQKFLERFGWTNDFQSFVIGNDVIGQQDILYQAPGEGEKQLAEAFCTQGTLEGWKAVISLLKGRKWALYKLFQAFIPPLLPVLEMNGYTFSNHGESSQGKTLSDSIAGSVWGNINYNANAESLIVQGMDITKDKLEKVLSTMRHIPVFLQDVHETRPDVIINAVHQVELGKAKGRGHNSNGSQASRTIKTVLFLTSEAPLSSMSENGGVFARAVEFTGSVFGEHDALFKRKVMNIIFEHYGHPGRAFVQYVMNNRAKWSSWRKAYFEDIENTLSEIKESGHELDAKLERKIPYIAAVERAAKIAAEALRLPITEEEIETIVAECGFDQLTKTDSAPYYEKAMNVLRDWVAANKNYFWVIGGDNNADEKYGFPGLWNLDKRFMAMTRSQVTDVLKREGFDINRCLGEWKEAGYLITGKDGKTQMVTHLPYSDTKARMLRFPIDRIEAEGEAE